MAHPCCHFLCQTGSKPFLKDTDCLPATTTLYPNLFPAFGFYNEFPTFLSLLQNNYSWLSLGVVSLPNFFTLSHALTQWVCAYTLADKRGEGFRLLCAFCRDIDVLRFLYRTYVIKVKIRKVYQPSGFLLLPFYLNATKQTTEGLSSFRSPVCGLKG